MNYAASMCDFEPVEGKVFVSESIQELIRNLIRWAGVDPAREGLFAFDRPLDGPPSVMRDRGDIAWAARNNAKPSRSEPEAWVVQASTPWSQSTFGWQSAT